MSTTVVILGISFSVSDITLVHGLNQGQKRKTNIAFFFSRPTAMHTKWAPLSALLWLQWSGIGSTQAVYRRSQEPVYRVDWTKPEDIKRLGGFRPAEIDLAKADFSVYNHARDNSPGSAYVSTSKVRTAAESFAVSPSASDKLGGTNWKPAYLYEIQLMRDKPTPNFVDTVDTLGKYATRLNLNEQEVLAAGGVRWDQVKGYTFLPKGKDTPQNERVYIVNDDYDKKFDKLTHSGGQTHLIGLPDGEQIPDRGGLTTRVRGISPEQLRDNGLAFIDKTGEAVGLSREKPIFNPSGRAAIGTSRKSDGTSHGKEGNPSKGNGASTSPSRQRYGLKTIECILFRECQDWDRKYIAEEDLQRQKQRADDIIAQKAQRVRENRPKFDTPEEKEAMAYLSKMTQDLGLDQMPCNATKRSCSHGRLPSQVVQELETCLGSDKTFWAGSRCTFCPNKETPCAASEAQRIKVLAAAGILKAKDLPQFMGGKCLKDGDVIECGGGLNIEAFFEAELKCPGEWNPIGGSCLIVDKDIPDGGTLRFKYEFEPCTGEWIEDEKILHLYGVGRGEDASPDREPGRCNSVFQTTNIITSGQTASFGVRCTARERELVVVARTRGSSLL
ncbi:hypothetical protein L249_0735 [Ophiocordyceps polyrhachis-furcata BCC 54312]|uniref:Heat-labile enterotoxin n=1 Tax=Ophiocordyceps polyrhachis-furcata BCC 54312 TaxID=1330021 RepID=A0A367LCB8_9HYPO|nr:hypothetical protein L249_0735 [Ophiocordyceps polyrhachis-furcata BCC 54312]